VPEYRRRNTHARISLSFFLSHFFFFFVATRKARWLGAGDCISATSDRMRKPCTHEGIRALFGKNERVNKRARARAHVDARDTRERKQQCGVPFGFCSSRSKQTRLYVPSSQCAAVYASNASAVRRWKETCSARGNFWLLSATRVSNSTRKFRALNRNRLLLLFIFISWPRVRAKLILDLAFENFSDLGASMISACDMWYNLKCKWYPEIS